MVLLVVPVVHIHLEVVLVQPEVPVVLEQLYLRVAVAHLGVEVLPDQVNLTVLAVQ
jgi:hypothetical protein